MYPYISRVRRGARTNTHPLSTALQRRVIARRTKNRVNAAISRKKRENYITWLERKAGYATTDQGTEQRKRAVTYAWQAVHGPPNARQMVRATK